MYTFILKKFGFYQKFQMPQLYRQRIFRIVFNSFHNFVHKYFSLYPLKFAELRLFLYFRNFQLVNLLDNFRGVPIIFIYMQNAGDEISPAF